MCIAHFQMANTIKMVAQCPNVQFVLDHIGKPDIKNNLMDPWRAEIKTLSEFPNVAAKYPVWSRKRIINIGPGISSSPTLTTS